MRGDQRHFTATLPWKGSLRRREVRLPSRLRDIHATADGNKIAAHACCPPQNPSLGRVLLWNYFRVSSSKRAGKHSQIGPRSAQNLAQICLCRFQLTAASFRAGGSFKTCVNGLRKLCLVRGHFYFGTIQDACAIRHFGYKELKETRHIVTQLATIMFTCLTFVNVYKETIYSN